MFGKPLITDENDWFFRPCKERHRKEIAKISRIQINRELRVDGKDTPISFKEEDAVCLFLPTEIKD